MADGGEVTRGAPASVPHDATRAAREPSGALDAPWLSVIVPLYDEGPTLEASLQRLLAWLQRSGHSWELLLIDDASRDATRATADDFVARHPQLPLRCAHHPRNTGRGRVVRDGLAAARGQVAGYLDIDLEVAEDALGPCLAALSGGADVAVGRRRYALEPHSLLRHVLSRGYSRLVRALLGTRLRDTESGCKWFRMTSIAPLLPRLVHDGWFFDTEIMMRAERAGLAIAEVPVEFRRRFDKTSTVRPLRDSLAYLGALLRFRLSLWREDRRAAR